jgi:hypothetical protein
MRRKACRAAHNVAQQTGLDTWLAAHAARQPAQPLPASMVPVHTFSVQVREGDSSLCMQRFACMPAGNGCVLLCANPARGPRNVGQWPFANAQAAEAWAHQYFGFNGCAIRT